MTAVSGGARLAVLSMGLVVSCRRRHVDVDRWNEGGAATVALVFLVDSGGSPSSPA